MLLSKHVKLLSTAIAWSRRWLSALASSRAAPSLRLLALAEYALFGLLTETILLAIKPLPQYLLEDFSYYLQAYLAATHGGDPYHIHWIGAAFLYPPPALLVVGAFALLPDVIPRAIAFVGVNLLLLGAMLAGVARCYQLPLRRCWWWFPLAFFFAPLLEMLQVGQINLIAALGIFLPVLYDQRRPLIAGLSLSLAICLKVTPLAFLPFLLVQRRWAALAWTAVWLVVQCALAVLFFGWQPFITYIDVFRTLLDAVLPSDGNAQALGPLLGYHGWIPLGAIQPVQHLLALSMLIVFASSAALAYMGHQREPLFLILSLGSMIAPNTLWYHHYVFLLLPIFIWLAWSRLHPAVVTWCFLGLNVIQIDRWFLTRGLLAQAFVYLSILGILAWQIKQSRATQALNVPNRGVSSQKTTDTGVTAQDAYQLCYNRAELFPGEPRQRSPLQSSNREELSDGRRHRPDCGRQR